MSRRVKLVIIQTNEYVRILQEEDVTMGIPANFCMNKAPPRTLSMLLAVKTNQSIRLLWDHYPHLCLVPLSLLPPLKVMNF